MAGTACSLTAAEALRIGSRDIGHLSRHAPRQNLPASREPRQLAATRNATTPNVSLRRAAPAWRPGRKADDTDEGVAARLRCRGGFDQISPQDACAACLSRNMRALRLALQLNILYVGSAVLVGVARSPAFTALAAFAVASFFAGCLLLTRVTTHLAACASTEDVQARRYAVATLLLLPALVALVLAHGVLLGSWRGPSRWAGLHAVAIQFAGAWSVVLLLALAGAVCLALAYRVLRIRAP